MDVAKAAKKAHWEGATRKEATVTLGFLTPEEFDQRSDQSSCSTDEH